MLRAKQIGTVSQYARSFFINGSRTSPVDGSPCTYSEDEAGVPRRQQRGKDIIHPQNASTIISRTATSGILPYGDAVGIISRQKSENATYPASVARVLSTPNSSLKSDGETPFNGDVNVVQKDVRSVAHVASNFVNGGIASAGLLSDPGAHKLAISDPGARKLPISGGNHVYVAPQTKIGDTPSSVSSISPSTAKPHKRENFSEVHGKPMVEMVGGSNSSNLFHDTNIKVEKSRTVKSFDHVSSKAVESSVGTSGIHSHTRERQPVSQRSKANVSKYKPRRQTSEQKDTAVADDSTIAADNVHKQPRYTRAPAKTTHVSGQYGNAGVVERVYDILQQRRWGPATETALNNLNCSMSVYQANQVLKRLQDHSVACGFFHWLKFQTGFKHDEHSYTTMVGILGRARQFSAINKLLDEMVRVGCLPNVVTYNRLIHSYGRANYLDDAINVFYQMQRAGCKPDRVTYCTLIDIHAKAGFLDVAMDMYKRMQEAGLSPDTFTYSVIINCLGKAGHLATAYQLFCEMVAQGCVPNLVTYNIMIALQAKARNYPCALKLYRDMQTAGFQPDRVTYSIVMEVLGHCGHLEEAEALFTEMISKNWIPDEPVYGLLVDLWGKAGNVDKAQAWYQEMLNAGLRPNVPTCNSLLSAFLRVHRFSDAYHVLQSMPGLGLNPSLQTYTLLLSCCTDTQYIRDMGLCCELMAVTGHPAHAFLQSMPAAGPDGQNVRDHASYFLDMMHSEDRESKRGLVDAVIDFLHKSGFKEEAGSVWEVAAQKSVYPDAVREKSSCYWLINLHVMSDGTAVTALSRTLAWFRRQMLDSGVGPSRIDIVTGWGRRSRVTGSSLVRHSVKELLHIFEFPFFTENGNTGCFVGRGEPLNQWLLHSYVERMHLL